MTNYRIDSSEEEEEEEAISFPSYPYDGTATSAALYYVQSPSTISHANSSAAADVRNVNHELELLLYHNSPLPSEHYTVSSPLSSSAITNNNNGNGNAAADVFKKGSTSSSYNKYHQSQLGSLISTVGGEVMAGDGRLYYYNYKEDEKEEEGKDNDGLSSSSSSCLRWKGVQVTWKLLVSMAVALTVFYLVTMPPPPNLSLQMGRIKEFELAEGVDRTGVSTKMLTWNCTVKIVIENKSKIFGLHIQYPPHLDLLFGTLPLAVSPEGEGDGIREVVAEADGFRYMRMNVETRSKAIYGAGTNMQDLLESKKGLLPLTIRLHLISRFHVIFGLINPIFHHHLHCFILLSNHYDTKHKTFQFISNCSSSSSSTTTTT